MPGSWDWARCSRSRWFPFRRDGALPYRCEFDSTAGTLGEPQLAAELTSPSFLTLRPDGKVLYAVGETSGTDGGGVFAFAVDAKSGSLTKLAETTSGGAGPCHVVCHPSGRELLVANYGAGSWSTHLLFRTGKFVPDSRYLSQLEGSGPNRARQAASHAHCGAFSADGKALFVSDLGGDVVHALAVDEAKAADETDERWSGRFLLSGGMTIKLPPGSGPRHFALDPAGGLMFVCGELDSTLNVVRFDLAKGTSEVAQSASTLPGGKPVKGNSTAEVVRHPSGKYVYVSNRGHNSVAAFGWDGQKLTPVGPRHGRHQGAAKFQPVAGRQLDAGSQPGRQRRGRVQGRGRRAADPDRHRGEGGQAGVRQVPGQAVTADPTHPPFPVIIAAIRRLAVLFHANGYVRRPDPDKKSVARGSGAYHKGYEVRLVLVSAGELEEVRGLLAVLAFPVAKPHAKNNQFRQPIYGKAAVERFLALMGDPPPGYPARLRR